MPFAIIHNSFRWRVNTQGARRQGLEFVDLAEIYLPRAAVSPVEQQLPHEAASQPSRSVDNRTIDDGKSLHHRNGE